MQNNPSTTLQLYNAMQNNAGNHYQRGSDRRERPRQPLHDAAKKAAENAAEGAFKMLPIYGGLGLLLLAAPNKDPIAMVKPLAPFLAIGGFIVDVIKFPFYFAYATEEAARAGITKIASVILEKSPELEFEKSMLESFIIRFMQTAKLACALGLYDAEQMRVKLDAGDIEDLIGLTLLHTAYVSRYAMDNHLLLANDHYLDRADCPQKGLALFDLCHEAKEIIRDALGGMPQRLDNERHQRDSNIVSNWIPYIHAGKRVDANQFPGTDPRNIERLNKLIALLHPMAKAAQEIMPVENIEVGHRAAGFRK